MTKDIIGDGGNTAPYNTWWDRRDEWKDHTPYSYKSTRDAKNLQVNLLKLEAE